MYRAIRAVGCDRVTLSSGAVEPLFPNSVECMRLMRAYMRAFGLSAEEVEQVTVTNRGASSVSTASTFFIQDIVPTFTCLVNIWLTGRTLVT